jgi:hypothetical protein
MNVHLVLSWNWDVNCSKGDNEFSVVGAFSNEEDANFYCDRLQEKYLTSQNPGPFYWVEIHEMDKMMVGEM